MAARGVAGGNRCAGLFLVVSCLIATVPPAGQGAEESAGGDLPEVVASVDTEAISAAELKREVERAAKGTQLDRAQRDALTERVLQTLIDRRLALHYLARTGQGASPADLEQAWQRLQVKLGQRQQTLSDYLQREAWSEADLRRQLAWQLGWPRFLQRYLTDENLQRYFQQHQREFDGTRLRVAHILWRLAAPEDSAEGATVREQAQCVRDQLQSGQLTFAAAARRYSTGATKDQGGELGWIERHAPMPEAFSRAAYALQRGELSQPVTTVFGVHVIQCLEVEAGSKSWLDVRDDLTAAVTRYLFDWVCQQERERVVIRRFARP